MQSPNRDQSSSSNTSTPTSLQPPLPSLPKLPDLHCLKQHWNGFLTHCSSSLKLPLPHFHINGAELKTHFKVAAESVGDRAKQAIKNGASLFSGPSSEVGSSQNPVWARVSGQNRPINETISAMSLALSPEAIEERLAGIPVYCLSNSDKEFVLISGSRTGKSLGLFCFKEEDAETLLQQMKSMDPGMRHGSKVVSVALNKVVQLKVDGVAFRFIPDHSQLRNALKEKKKEGVPAQDFCGVPVFKSQSLILRSGDKRYCPVFFRKEDLELSLSRASRDQRRLNPLMKGDIQVCAFEEIIKGMKENHVTKWDNVVFIPPGFEVSTDVAQQRRQA
ncbi:hypothetical protein AMTRI_Chr06g194870 [Amborella trichopoda]|uniref:Protein TIC 22-like, chloroplastic n=1 Tax=Amborella trichopoda TaxID=13333 RepID=W1PS07_AMBTC|nr:protein TIC 22-like, chloroplastic [Amborella trichopoda]ERN10040.1 hypothetical protein AMTR_s00013p00248340 [Amborella trichopoda]|eukprot:XP_006848459.1 protein TIC 22-like, chloroplastic [Amborella trichopoda]